MQVVRMCGQVSGADGQTPAQPQPQIAQQRAPAATTATQQLVLQSQQAAAAAAATGHVILQPGQQLISATPGQHVLTSVDGRTQQMTVVQGPTSVAAASLLVSDCTFTTTICLQLAVFAKSCYLQDRVFND